MAHKVLLSVLNDVKLFAVSKWKIQSKVKHWAFSESKRETGGWILIPTRSASRTNEKIR